MNTTNTDILKSFYSVTNRNKLTQEIYDILLKRWDLDKVNLDEEMLKINLKKSTLTRSGRNAVPEFIKLRSMLNQQLDAKKTASESISMNDDSNDDTVLVGGDFGGEGITNQNQVESNAEIC